MPLPLHSVLLRERIHTQIKKLRHQLVPLAVSALVLAKHDTALAEVNLAGEVQMTNPPVVTLVGPMLNPPVVTNAVLFGPDNAAFRSSGADVRLWADTYPRYMFVFSFGITGLYAELPYRVEFETDAQVFQILTLGNLSQYRLKVDGEYTQLQMAQGPPPDGNFYWLNVAFTKPGTRAIRLESWNQPFGGVAVDSTCHISSPTPPLGRRCIVLGDSFTEGLLSYAQRLADMMGWEVWGSGVGGTGYLNPGPAGRVKFRDRVQSDVIAHNPDIVLVAGGINDGAYPPAALQAEAQALYDTLTTNLPSTQVVVVGPWWPRGNPPQAMLDTRDALKAAAASRGLQFIDPIVATNVQQVNVGWITGTGNVGSPVGDGNADFYISADGTHPTDLGHQYLATKLAAPLRAILVADPTPTLGLRRLTGLEISGRVGRTYLVQWSADLGSNWLDATTVTLNSSPQLWVDTSSTNSGNRFYRAQLLP